MKTSSWLAMGLVGVSLWLAPAASAQLFAPNSYRNQPLANNAPIDPNSATMVQDLDSQVQSGDLGNSPPWINTTSYSDPVYTVPATQPKVKVTVVGDSSGDQTLQTQFKAVPLPSNAVPDPGTDGSLTVYQPSTDKLWDFWVLRRPQNGSGWTAMYGGEIGSEQSGMLGVSQNPGYWTDPPTGFGHLYGATATSIPWLVGLQRISELQAFAINHVVSFSMPRPAGCFRWPAQRQDQPITADNSDPLAPPEGAILRLPPTLNIDALNIPPYTKILAKAVQKYGMVLQDRDTESLTQNQTYGNVSVYAEEPQSGDPYHGSTGIFGGYNEADLMNAFPWSRLEVLAVPPGHNPCQQ